MILSKTYQHQNIEEKIYRLWEKSGFFTPKISKNQKPFVISMPPPNITGKLHIGHAMFVTLEDILIRYHRMKGEPTLWLPGTDHAGIATQNVVEKDLKKEGISKQKLGRKKFVQKVWEWKKEYGSEITKQIKALGASCDWSRERFTLDEGLSKAVNEAFKRLYDKGLIYQGLKTVNWCPRCHSAIADDEVEYKKEKGKLYFLKYGPFALTTTRPETKLGDTAVAVHPKDKRYRDMVGKKYKIQGVLGKFEIIIVADNAVNPEFGTGAVKVTPAHSLVDFEIAQRHNIPLKQVIDENGKMMQNTGKYTGMTTGEAREEIVKDMQKMGLIKKIDENYEHNVGVCYRCGGIIEPIPSKQWFIKMKTLVKPAIKAVKSGEIKIIPKRFEKIYFHWLLNVHDWCISRQLWWGHRIPAYYRKQGISNEIQSLNNKNLKVMGFNENVVPQIFRGKTKTYRIRDHKLKIGDKVYFENSKTGEIFGFGTITESIKTKVKNLPLRDKSHGAIYNKLDELIAAFKLYNPEKKITSDAEAYIYTYDFTPKEKSENSPDTYVGTEPPKGDGWVQDPDVLDTWFSSSLWPFSTLGWPEKTNDYEYFYPTTVMETGYDILFFWVARMIIMGLELTDKIPFKAVYLHGLVRDEHNRKMSKSLGNVINPIDMIEKYGTDAVRMSLVVGSTPGNDVAIGEAKIKGYRNFSNKIWNITRFIMMNIEDPEKLPENPKYNKIDLSDMKKLDEVVKKITLYLDEFQFSRAGELIYQYVWHEFADKIIEEAKPRLQGSDEQDKKATQKKLFHILITSLKLLHPFMPFITEEIWEKIPRLKKESLIISRWPK